MPPADRAGTLVRLPTHHVTGGRFLDKGLTGFDVGTWKPNVRPEFLRLVKRGTNRSADGDFALAA